LVNHPLAAPLQTNLETLIQGMTGASFKISKADDVKIDFDKIKPTDDDSKNYVDLVMLVYKLVERLLT